jgi:hypothetical protein
MKRIFGKVEAVFNATYLSVALGLGIFLVITAGGWGVRSLAGIMALVLAGGDAFHLVPRIFSILYNDEERFRKALGIGKMITSVTMTWFYVLLWHVGLFFFQPHDIGVWSVCLYFLALLRSALCIMPQNQWEQSNPPVRWGIWRNLPFAAMGLIVAGLFFVFRDDSRGIGPVWAAVLMSFLFYLPVVLFSRKYPRIGMLMLPKTLMYVWILMMCLALPGFEMM